MTPHDPKNVYVIEINRDQAGVIYHKELKRGFFKKLLFDAMSIYGKGYRRFGIGLGREGNCSPIYYGNIQIAQFQIEPEVINECFHYHCASLDEQDGLIALFFSCYSYITACYRPGQKTIRLMRRTYSKTTDAFELQYYDPGFIYRVDE